MKKNGSKEERSFTESNIANSITERLSSLPTSPGVYQFLNSSGKIIYVGKAQNLRSRVRQYFYASRSKEPRLQALVSKISDIETIITDTEVEALILEATLIKKIKPRYNVDLKDDKSYPYIVITNEPYPRVFVTRKIIRDGSKYFGPYTDVKNVRFALKTLRDIFMIRSCNYDLSEEAKARKKYKVCLDYHIKKCGGGCADYESSADYQKMISHVERILKGKVQGVIETLHKEMEHYAAESRYEEAARLRDRLNALEIYRERQKVVDSDGSDRDVIAVAVGNDQACGMAFLVREGKLVGKRNIMMSNVEGKSENELLEVFLTNFYLENADIPPEVVVSAQLANQNVLKDWLSGMRKSSVAIFDPSTEEKGNLIQLVRSNAQYMLEELELQKAKRGEILPHVLKSLQRDLRLEKPPRRMECLDISNLQGTDAVASITVFVDAKPKKSEYRRYKIKEVVGPDDFASMKEVVKRRFKRMLDEKEILPDLLIVDGGKGQLSSVKEILSELGLEKLPVMGLAKRLEEVFLPGETEALAIPKTSSSLRLLQQIRNEAHRFAITYHRKVRSKRILNTELDLIKGIGEKRAKELLEVFGSVQGVKFATEEQLADVVGPAVAAEIYDYFEKKEKQT